MRITGGEYRGRILQAPKGDAIRPTSDKVRQAIFNMLNARGLVQDAAILDVFCGTGALGIEALSWGASSAAFMDKNKTSLDLAKSNHAALKISVPCSFVLKDATKPGAKPENIAAANLVFLDPPYNQNLVSAALSALADGGWMDADAHILIETERGYDASVLTGYDVLMTRDYGDTAVALLAKNQG